MKTTEDIDQKFKKYVNKSPKLKTAVHWWDLYLGHYIKIEPSLQRQIFNRAIKKAGGHFSCLARKLKISRRTIAECSKGNRNPQISTLLKIANFINYPLSKIEKNIIQLSKSKFKPRLPFKLNTLEGAEIRAAFLSDGHLPSSPTQCPMYSAYEKELHWKLIETAHKLFGVFPCEVKKGNKTHQTRLPAVVGRALELSGIPRGDKRLVNCYVPRDILLGNKNVQIAYLRRVFDDEGDVCFDIYGKRAVRITRSTDITNEDLNFRSLRPQKWISVNKPSTPINTLLSGEQLLLQKLGIDARMYFEGIYKSRKNKITAKWRIQIGQQDSLRKFAEIINFTLKNKRRKLSNALKSYRVREFPNGEAEKFAVKVLDPIYKKRGYFFFSDLGKELVKIGRTYDLAGYYLRTLTEKKVIKKVRYGQYAFIS